MAKKGSGSDRRPNLVFITVDQMRGDCLGSGGHPIVETPNLDTMALQGVRFSRAYSATPTCIPARAAMLTGMTQEAHGRVGYEDGVAWTYETTLPGELAKAGYHTQGVGKMHFSPARSLCGFHNVVLHDGYLHHERNVGKRTETIDDYVPWLRERAGAAADYASNGLGCNSWVARPWHLPEELHPTNWVVEKSMEFLSRRDPARPFFLWMSFVRPHAPLDPPQAYWDMYKDADIPPPPVGDWAEPGDGGAIDSDAYRGVLEPKALRRARAAYYGLITHIDHQLGRFREALHEHDLLDNTFVIFTSDHGELLGDHNLFRKALPYEGSARIPFIAWAPKQFDMGVARGSVVECPVELRDVMPTFLEAAGVEVPATVEGKSLMPLVRGEECQWRSDLHGEHVFSEESVQYMTDGREKYVWYSGSGREELFDIAADPEELRDLSADAGFADRIAFWRGRLAEELEAREEGLSDGRKLTTGRPVGPLLKSVFPDG